MSSEVEGISLCQELQTLCAKGGFRLTKWISNSRVVLSSILEEEGDKDIKELDLDQERLP